MPVQSLICNPEPHSIIGGANGMINHINVKGVAWSGRGNGIHRVDVSINGGTTFTAAELTKLDQPRMRQWAWVQFDQDITLTDEQKAKLKRGQKVELELCSKAVNGCFDVQPERSEPYYNARGVCINHWYRVPVVIDPSKPAGFVQRVDPDDQFSNKPTGGNFHTKWISDEQHIKEQENYHSKPWAGVHE